MGTCFSQEGRKFHERLHEYDDDYFIKVEKRNSIDENETRWWRNRSGSIASNSTAMLTSHGCETSPSKLPVDHWTKQTSEREPSHLTTDAFEDISFSLSSPPSLHNISLSSFSQPISFSETHISPRKQKIWNDGHVSELHGKHKGRALQLRLAKHRHLQIAVTSQHTSPGSSTTQVELGSKFLPAPDAQSLTDEDIQDSSVSSPATSSASFTSQSSSKEENMNSRGHIWKEITSESNITALAMNRLTSNSSYLQSGPLMLAMGDENGTILITQIMDEGLHKMGDKDSDDSSLESNTDLENGALEFSIDGRVRSLDFGSSEHLVVGGDGCYAWIMKIVFDESSQTLQEIKVVQKIERIDRIYAVSFSIDQKFLAVGGFDGRVAIIPTTTIRNQEEQKAEESDDGDDSLSEVMKDVTIELDRPGLIYCLDWSSVGNFLAIGGSDKVCGIYNASTFDLIHETPSRPSAIQAVRWSHDGNFIAIGDREVSIVDGKPPFKTQREISHTPKSSTMAQFRYHVTSLCWSPSDSFLAIGGSDGRCLIVETNSWALVYEHQRTESINALAWGQQSNALNGDIRRYLVVSDNDCTVALIKAGTETQSSDNTNDHSSIASSSHYSQGTMSTDWVLREDEFRDLDDIPQEKPRGLKSQATITAVAFSKVGKGTKTSSYLAYAADDCSLTIMTTRDWKAIFQVEFAKPIQSLVFSNSSTYLALGGDEGVLNVLSVRSRTMILNSILSSPIKSIAFSRHDERLGVGLEDGILALLCPESDWESVGEIDQKESSITCQDWTSKTLACGRMDGSVALFNTDQIFGNFFVPIAEFTSNLPVRSVAFGKNEGFLSIGGDNGVVSILSATDGWVLSKQLNLGCGILSTKWSPAGRFIALAGSGETFLICDTVTWATINEVKEIRSSIFTNNITSMSCLDWSLDSKWVAVGGSGSGIHILNTLDWTLVKSSADDDTLAASETYA
uniref:Anaphase-promoting complex subunit 4-like WD40 domain-containing protein n=1 Tax=Pseudo-nitzschia australis TaxID=44445 RepID=A0A7S4EQY9_9STRA